jgi:DNA-binding transcriptional ArsR family regulator
MVKYLALDRQLSAIADPKRRQILERLALGPATVSALAAPLAMSLPGLLKHVRILEDADLVRTERVGRTRECRLGDRSLDDAAEWVDAQRRLWERRIDRLEDYLANQKERTR